jgi:type II secretory pathway pseudopilin PulG
VTLIEVIAGLVVLAVLVCAVALARGRFMRQWEGAQRRTQAAEAVDRMLASWMGGDGDDSIPVPARGSLAGVEGCAWRTEWVPESGAARLGAGVVRLEVVEAGRRLMAIDVMKHVRGRNERQERP